VLGREAVDAHLARLCGEKEADGEEHDLGQPPGSAGDQPRRGADFVQYVVAAKAEPGPVPEAVCRLAGSVQVTQRELGACYQQFGPFGAGHAGTGVLSGEQPAVVKQVQPVQRREPATAALAPQGGWCSPEHREPLVQPRSSGSHGAGHRADGQAILRPDRVLQDEPEIDVAHQRTEASVGQAAERVSSDQA